MGRAERAIPLATHTSDGFLPGSLAPSRPVGATLAPPRPSASPELVQEEQGSSRRRSTRRVAVLNEWFENAGGAEQVLLAVRAALPGADTYVLWSDRDLAAHPGITESWLARTPLRGRKALSLPLMPLVWRTQTRQRYDVVLTLSHSLNHTARFPVNPGGVHLAYVHTPARYVWLPEIDPRRTGLGQRAAVRAVKGVELRSNRHVTSYAANSQAVRRRIEQFWHRSARVIHPPCRTSFFGAATTAQRDQDRDYLLGFGRWVAYKRYDFMIEVAARAGVPLVIAGGGPEEARLRRLAEASGADVRFEVNPTDERLRHLAWGARAVLSPGHEDFGIVAVEAQACGTPVIGLRGGGLLDTVIDGHTGHLLDDLDVGRFADRVRCLQHVDRTAIRANADRFSEQAFRRRITAWVDELAER